MKKTVLYVILDLIFVMIFNVIFFTVGGTDHPSSVWLSYAFIHFAYAMLLVTPLLVRKSSSSHTFSSVLSAISSTYFFAELIVGSVFILLSPDSVKAAFLVQIVIFAIYAFFLISNMISNENTADSLERHETELKFVKECSAKLKYLMDTTSDYNIKKCVESAYDAVHSSQVKSNIAVRQLELQVINLTDTLSSQVRNGLADEAASTANAIISAVCERNTQLKLMN